MNYQYVNTDALEAAIKAVAGEDGVAAVEDLYEAIDAVERQAISEGFEAGLEAATMAPIVEGSQNEVDYTRGVDGLAETQCAEDAREVISDYADDYTNGYRAGEAAGFVDGFGAAEDLYRVI